jgi:hypothetical protein
MRNVSDTICTKIQSTVLAFNINFFCKKNLAVYEILWSQAGHRWQYGAQALHAGHLRLQIGKVLPLQA